MGVTSSTLRKSFPAHLRVRSAAWPGWSFSKLPPVHSLVRKEGSVMGSRPSKAARMSASGTTPVFLVRAVKTSDGLWLRD
jgi:hypothetical protein